MAKQIEVMSAAKQAEAVAKLLAKRAERLQTKKYPRPAMFAKEMRESELLYTNRVRSNANLAYVKKICKAAGLATDETTQDWDGVRAKTAMRSGVFMQSGWAEDFVTISVHGSTDEHAYVVALAEHGLVALVTYAAPSIHDSRGYGRANIYVEL